MAQTATPNADALTRRQNALAEINFASIVDDDLTPSEDETPDEQRLELETVQSTIGVSIGQQQTRLTSPKTPAAEKAAALESTEDGLFFDGWEHAHETQSAAKGSPQSEPESEPQGQTDGAISPRTTPATVAVKERNDAGLPQSSTSPQKRLPSPWRAGPKTFNDKVSDHRAALRQQFQGQRRRASSNGSMTEAMRRFLPFHLPSSIPRSYKDLHFSLPSFSALSLDSENGKQASTAHQKPQRQTLTDLPKQPSIPPSNTATRSTQQSASNFLPEAKVTGPSQTASTAPLPQREFSDSSSSTLAVPPPRPSRDRPVPRLRHSNSEGSLMVYRTKSFASSLGDDSRFESVQEMANSRLKALKDSWQDSNFKLSSPSFPNFNFGARDDVFKNRNGTATPKAREPDDGTSHRVSFMTTIPSRRASTKPKRSLPGNTADGETHPFFAQAVQELEGDLVILGGYRGSILRSAEPPNRQLWVPIKVGLNLRKVDLEVPLDPDADENMEKTIIPSGMLTHIGPVDISKRLFKRLNASENARDGKLRVHNYGYDWRLSPHFLSRRLIQFLESLPCNQPGVAPEKRGAYVIAHSLGGLITRHAINERPDLVAGVVYAGVPQRCVNILGPFRNGDDVLLSSRVLTAQVNFTIRTSYALLPLDGKCFINKYTKEEYPVDFFDVNTWIEHRLSPCLAAPLPRPEQSKDSSFSVSGIMNAVSSALPSFPARKGSLSLSKTLQGHSNSSGGDVTKDVSNAAQRTADKVAEGGANSAGMEPQMGRGHQSETSKEPNPATDVTIPYDKAVEYLTRTLAEVKAFKQELAHRPEHTTSNAYPPISLIYGKSTPTVVGAKVESLDAIKRADVYDELAFGSGDGVVLARAAMVPEGYSAVRGGVVSSDRGHVTLLGDLEAVGRCLHAIVQARKSGVGLGAAKLKQTKDKGDDGLAVQSLPLKS